MFTPYKVDVYLMENLILSALRWASGFIGLSITTTFPRYRLLQRLCLILFVRRSKYTRNLSAIIPVPPSNPDRPFQPVQELALEVGRRAEIPVATDYLKKIKKTPPLKDVDDTQSRKQHLRGAFVVADRRFAGKYVLVLDDLYRSGETLSEVTRVLMQQGKVSKVFVLTITKTRTKR